VLSSASTSLLLSPLTVIKVRLQNMSRSSTSSSLLTDVIKNIHRNEGIGGFWNGGKTALIQGLPSSIVYLTAYERIKLEMCKNTDPSSSWRQYYVPPISAAIARTLAVTCVAPLELIRTIQAGGIEKSITGIVRDIVQQTGVRGLYKGWSSTLMRDVPYSALYWSSFEVGSDWRFQINPHA
jgi:solute carrier family 25, member 39/40